MSAALHSSSVQILGTSCVKPLHATKRFNLFLPFADSCLKPYVYIRDVLFYSIAADDAGTIFSLEALKHGLSLALVHFYPVAGRLHDDHETGQLTIDCNDAGVEFVEAVTNCAFAELEEKSFPIYDFYNDLARFCYTKEPPLDAPLLSIQVTRFQGGRGIAIGVAASHVVFDGHSRWYFLKSWALCCRGQDVSLPPLHARALMSSKFWGMDKLSKNSFNMKNDHIHFPRPPPCAKAYHKVMQFDSTTAQQLKRTAIEESGNARISTFQAVIACAWKRITVAQDLPPHHKMRLHIPGDVRHRLMPSLTDAYFGNALVGISISTTAGDLQRESLGVTAAKIMESLKVLEDQAYLRERMATMEEEFSNFLDKTVRDGGQTLFVAGGLRHPVYDVDVGAGKPVAVRPATMHNDSQIYVYGGREHGSINVCLRFSSLQTLQAFLSITSPCIDI